ncbi:hypothetical protein ACJJTC_019050 [Scirpophaga incertulas]
MKRSTYIAQIWCNAYKQIPSTLLPIRYGWILNDGRYDFDWFHGEECPQKVCDITAPDEESGEENDDVIVLHYTATGAENKGNESDKLKINSVYLPHCVYFAVYSDTNMSIEIILCDAKELS